MKALVYEGPRQVSVTDVPDAKIEQPTDVLVRITSTNICGSDLHICEGWAAGRPPRVATPGHTEGHVSFMFEPLGAIITGDAIASVDVLTREHGPQLMPDPLNGNPQRTPRSLDLPAGLQADILLSGHGGPSGGEPQDAVARAKEADR